MKLKKRKLNVNQLFILHSELNRDENDRDFRSDWWMIKSIIVRLKIK